MPVSFYLLWLLLRFFYKLLLDVRIIESSQATVLNLGDKVALRWQIKQEDTAEAPTDLQFKLFLTEKHCLSARYMLLSICLWRKSRDYFILDLLLMKLLFCKYKGK